MEQEPFITALLQKKDTSAFCFLYDTYAASLYGFIIKIIPDKALAAQLLEQSFVTICSGLHLYDPLKEAVFSWMLRITLRHCSTAENFDKAQLLQYMTTDMRPLKMQEPLAAV